MTRARTGAAVFVAALMTTIAGCRPSTPPPATSGPASGAGDAAFASLAGAILDDVYARNPVLATDLGIHKYDDKIRDYSAEGVAAELQAARGFKARLETIDPATLSFDRQLDREQLLHAMDSL